MLEVISEDEIFFIGGVKLERRPPKANQNRFRQSLVRNGRTKKSANGIYWGSRKVNDIKLDI
jgi:hypothetical protein